MRRKGGIAHALYPNVGRGNTADGGNGREPGRGLADFSDLST